MHTYRRRTGEKGGGAWGVRGRTRASRDGTLVGLSSLSLAPQRDPGVDPQTPRSLVFFCFLLLFSFILFFKTKQKKQLTPYVKVDRNFGNVAHRQHTSSLYVVAAPLQLRDLHLPYTHCILKIGKRKKKR